MKRYLYIAFGILILIVAIVFVSVLKKPAVPTTSTRPPGSLPGVGTQSVTPPPSATLPAASPSGVTAGTGGISGSSGSIFGVLSNESVLNYFVNASNTVITVQRDGKIEQIAQGQSIYLSSSEINGLASAEFSYDGKKILVSFGNPLPSQWSIFDVATKAWTPLATSPIVAAWSPNNYQIAYFVRASGASALETLDLTNTKATPKLLASFPNQDFQISWPASSTILLFDKPSALFSGSILALNPKTGTFSSVVRSRVGLEAKWNAGGTMAAILVGTELVRGGKLGVIDGAGVLLHEMSFLTLPSKCVFATSSAGAAATATTSTAKATAPKPLPSLICGVPRNAQLLAGNPLPDAYYEERIMTADDIYKVNPVSGDIVSIFNDPNRTLDVSNVKVFNNILFFVNRYDHKLYAISL